MAERIGPEVSMQSCKAGAMRTAHQLQVQGLRSTLIMQARSGRTLYRLEMQLCGQCGTI